MKRLKSEYPSVRRSSFSYLLLGAAALYLTLIFFKFPDFLESTEVFSDNGFNGFSFGDENQHSSITPQNNATQEITNDNPHKKPENQQYGRITGEILRRMNKNNNMSLLERMADEAWALGLKAWEELSKYDEKEIRMSNVFDKNLESCPSWISMNGEELAKRRNLVIFLPCGLAAGSSISITGTPRYAHKEYARQLVKARVNDALVRVSQFMVELQGLKSVDGEDPPKILHLNPRLRGDWSYQPVIEHNTCYRMQWGTAQRCDGLPSKNDDMLVDGYLRCEKWMRNDLIGTKESKTLSWFDRFVGRPKKPEVTWPFPFSEGRMFILTVHAGVDGFHINVGGRHVTSFPYRTGFTLEDATGLAIKGDVDVHSVYATSLPCSHPSFSPNRVLDFSEKWKYRFSPHQGHARLFIGVLSASNHFAERMAVRKTWMQSLSVKSSNVAVRFFVALNPRTEVNAILRKEAAYFGDIEILQFMDRYELVVLKTIAICEYGVQNLTAEYIMKCDDDTFVRVEMILKVIEGFSPRSSLYLGNLNLLHRPLRTGKWAVSYEEWPEEIYPPYANGPGYIISSDIANYIISQRANHTLRLFKMEDVSMGMWVEKFNSTKRVKYSHYWKFCQYGCIQEYYTAHYQSPRQMICLWDNLMKGRAHCCNF